MSKKHLVLEGLLEHCERTNDLTFDNDLVKEFCKKYNFGNPFDVTKLDSSEKLPQSFKDEDICILHLGEGKHRFIKGIYTLYHKFEPIEEQVKWTYKKSLLDEYNDSESNILSVANNQRMEYSFNSQKIEAKNQQIEIDLTLEFNGVII